MYVSPLHMDYFQSFALLYFQMFFTVCKKHVLPLLTCILYISKSLNSMHDSLLMLLFRVFSGENQLVLLGEGT